MDTLLLLQLTLSFATGQALSPLTIATAVAEADSLWSRHDVAIFADECSAPVSSPVIRVAVAESMRALGARRLRAVSGAPRPLGAITFGEDGRAAPVISLFLADIMRLLAGVRVLGALESQWPPAMRERILGRVIGRVLAHEIGHYLLRTPGHSRAGLMRPVHATLMLVGPERAPLTLSNPEAARVVRQTQTQPEGAR